MSEAATKTPKPYTVCSCGNLIDLGDGPLTPENQITREHPACGRKTTQLRPQGESDAVP